MNIGCESLKYYLINDLVPRKTLGSVPSIIIPFSLDEVIEEVWLTQNQLDAESILETYHDHSGYGYYLLCEVLFGINVEIEYQNELSRLDILQCVLDEILP